MSTPSGNSPSFPTSAQESRRNNKRKLEDYPPAYEQYLQFKKTFLNYHARVCDICKSLIYGSKKAPQLEHACDSNMNSLAETQLVGDMILGHLDVIYRNVIEDLSSNYGYPKVDATTAVLATGICYGCEDPIGNALKHALTFLECGLRVDKPNWQNFFEDLKTLVKFVSMITYDEWRKKYPYLHIDDFLLWLLVYRKDPFDTSTMPKASVTEDDKLDASSPHSENDSEPKLTSATGLNGSASARFTVRTSLILPNSNPDAAKRNPMSSSDSLVGIFSSLTISESSIPKEKSLYANSKDKDSSSRGFMHRRPERRCQARLVGTTRKLVTKSTMLDLNCSLPKLDKKVRLELLQSLGTIDFSFNARSFACSSFSMNIVNTTTSLSHAANVDAFTSISSSKSKSDDASFIPNCNVASIPYLLEKLLSHNKDLQLQLEYWKNWAHHKVLQVTNELNKHKPELQRLRQEKLEAKKEEAFVDSTILKKTGEMDKALWSSKAQVEEASASLCKLELEKIRLEEELEAAKLRASESAANYEEASSKEIVTLKKNQTCERERALFQEELVSEKRMLPQLQKQLQQAQLSHGQLEDRWKQEERLKSKELIGVLNERKEHEKLEASLKSEEDMIRLKNEKDMQSCMDDFRKLRHKTAELKLMIDSANFARPDWVHSAYFTTDKIMGFKEYGIGEVHRDWECVMCLAEEISVVFLPCAHQVLCTKCNELHKKQGLGDCPSCRTPVKQRICTRSTNKI